MDDIDDLLDEVESKFCNSKKEKKVASTTTKTVARSPPRKKKNELDNIIDDIIADDGLDSILKSNAVSKNIQSNSSQHSNNSKVKCFSVFIGGTNIDKGYTSTGNQRSCDKLHCTSCDNKIVSFDGYVWSEDECEYLHFRNNYPDFDRLRPKLKNRKGYRAFCCQCCWVSTKNITELKNHKPNFKWICRKH